MPKNKKYIYKVNIEHLNIQEEKTSFSVIQIHNFITNILKQQYIDYDNSIFVHNRTLTRLIKKAPINDYLIFKAQKTLIRIYKDLNPNYKKVLQN